MGALQPHAGVGGKKGGLSLTLLSEVPVHLSGLTQRKGGVLKEQGMMRERHLLRSASSEAPPFCSAESDS